MFDIICLGMFGKSYLVQDWVAMFVHTQHIRSSRVSYWRPGLYSRAVCREATAGHRGGFGMPGRGQAGKGSG